VLIKKKVFFVVFPLAFCFYNYVSCCSLGYIDLSKRRVDPEDVIKCEERYNKAKAVHSVLRQVADQKKRTLEDLYLKIGWPLYRKFGHAYDAFKIALSDENTPIFDELEIEPEIKEALITYIKRKLAPQPVKIRADIEVTCFAYEGIDAIKEALAAGEKNAVAIKLIAAPIYVMTMMTLDKEHGIELMNQSIESIGGIIRSKG
jgi:translation initiation factor 2 subunit 1